MNQIVPEGIQDSKWLIRVRKWVRYLQSANTLSEIEQQLIYNLPWKVAAIFKIQDERNLAYANSIKGYEKLGIRTAEFPLFPENNMVAYCYKYKRTIMIKDDADRERYYLGEHSQKLWKELSIEKSAAVPLINSGKVVGVIFIAGGRDHDFSISAIRALELIAPILGFLIVKQEIMDVLEGENQVFRWIQEMSQILMFVQDEDELWWQFRDMLMQLGHINGGVFTLFEDGVWIVKDVFGPIAIYQEYIKNEFPIWLRSQNYQNWHENRFLWSSENVRILPPYVRENHENGQGVLSFVGDETELFAALALYSEREDALVQRLTPPLMQSFTLAYRLIRQRKILAKISTHDSLTGVWNRRALEAHIEKLMSGKDSKKLVMVLFDLDSFKQLNDREGHERGDDALIAVTKYFRTRMKDQDVIARLGGDEFVLLLHDTKWSVEVAEMLKTLVEESPLREFDIHMTMGVVNCMDECTDFQSCYRLADQRLYQGKRNGKKMISTPEGFVSLILN